MHRASCLGSVLLSIDKTWRACLGGASLSCIYALRFGFFGNRTSGFWGEALTCFQGMVGRFLTLSGVGGEVYIVELVM